MAQTSFEDILTTSKQRRWLHRPQPYSHSPKESNFGQSMGTCNNDFRERSNMPGALAWLTGLTLRWTKAFYWKQKISFVLGWSRYVEDCCDMARCNHSRLSTNTKNGFRIPENQRWPSSKKLAPTTVASDWYSKLVKVLTHLKSVLLLIFWYYCVCARAFHLFTCWRMLLEAPLLCHIIVTSCWWSTQIGTQLIVISIGVAEQ